MKKLAQLMIGLIRPLAVIFIIGTYGFLQASSTNRLIVENLYDGSEIEVSAEEANGKIMFTIANKGSDMDSERAFEVIEDDILIKIGNFDLNAQNGNELEFDVNAYPGIFTIYADQHTNHPHEAQAIASIEILPSNYVRTIQDIELDVNQFQLIESRDSDNEKVIKAQVYPNPCTDHLFIKSSTKGTVQNNQVTIYNAHGNIIEQIKDIDTTQQINTTKLKPGYYVISIQDEKGNLKNIKVIKN